MAERGPGLPARWHSGPWEAPERGGKRRGGGEGLGEVLTGIGGACAGRNLGGDEMAGGSSMGGGVRRCRVDEDR